MIAPSARLLKLPLIGFALVLLITVKTVPVRSVPEILGRKEDLGPPMVTPFERSCRSGPAGPLLLLCTYRVLSAKRISVPCVVKVA